MMFRTNESDLEVLGGLAPWIENTPEVAIALPAFIIENDILAELESTTHALIIFTEHLEGNFGTQDHHRRESHDQ